MERFSHRENVLLGYSPQRAFANPSSSTKAHQFRNSDVDFHDVFGGPPRRSSICEMRYSSSETMDSCSFKGDEETLSSRYSWTGVSEKPVFGEEGVNRRRSPSDDFFDDIFRGDDSSSSTPRKHDRDLFSSAPDSRLLSPAHPLPPKAEPFGSSSLPAQFSLPAKLANGMDFAAFASATRNLYKSKDGASNGKNYSHSPSASVSRFSSQAILGLDDSRNDVRPSYCQSPLSHEFSLSSEGSSKVKKSDKTDIVGNLKKDSNSLAVPSNCHQFHFSIYKWASKGVPLVMPPRGGNSSRLKEKGKTQRCSSSNGRVESESVLSESATAMRDIDFHSLNSSISASTKSLKMESEKKDNDSLLNTTTQDRVEPCQIAEEAVLAMPESKPPDSLQITVENVPGILCDTREETKPHSLPEIGLCEITEKEISVFTQETRKPDLKPLHSLLYDNDDGQGSDVITRKGGGKENMVKTTKKSSVNVDVGKNVKKQDRKRIISKGAEVDKASLQGSPINSGDNLGRNGIKGKVKEFVKIFNQEASSKPLINVGIRSQSFRWKNKSTHRAENEASVSTTGTDGKMHMPNVSKKKTYPDASFMVDENLKQSEKQHSGINTTIHKISDTSGQKNNSAPSSESIPDCSTTLGNTDESFEGNFLIKELSQDQNEPPQTGKDYEEKQVMQVSDAKIRQWSNGKEVNVRSLLSTLQYWSNGKEGNIRSLLSTLQYVLWPESGWRPVPLVDIIEGNAVKKAYQKALLCLHPDKLQQKGAASHQKYIAEKVFDILQEAWTHFNSLGSL